MRKPVILIAIVFLSLSAFGQYGRWAEPVNISNSPGGSYDPDMAIGPDGKIHVVYEDWTRLNNFNYRDIMYVVFDSYEWREPVQISEYDTTYAADPRIAVDSQGKPHVVWYDRFLFYDSDILYATLTDSGWTEPLSLTEFSPASLVPDIVIDSRDYVHIVWDDYYYGRAQIFHIYFNGNSWSNFVNVSNDPIDCCFPRITVDSNDSLHIVWRQMTGGGYDSEIFYSMYNGVSWRPGINISFSGTLQSLSPQVEVDRYNNPHVIWTQSQYSGFKEIIYTYFNGEYWSQPDSLTNLGVNSTYPSFAISRESIRCFIFSARRQSYSPYICYSFRRDLSWTWPLPIFYDYLGTKSAIAIDTYDVIHTCLLLSDNDYGEIMYTYYIPDNSISSQADGRPSYCIYLNNHPNPFNQSTSINFNVNIDSPVNLSVYNIRGELVKALKEGILSRGDYSVIWEGDNSLGTEVGGGIYFVRLQVDGESYFKKLILLK